MNLVTVVNRSSKPLSATWDGKIYEIAPGKCSLPEIVAEAARRQNPIMGTEDPFNGEMQYLVAIEEQGDPITPAEQSKEITRKSLKEISRGRQVEVVPGDNGLYNRNSVATSLPLDSVFVKP